MNRIPAQSHISLLLIFSFFFSCFPELLAQELSTHTPEEILLVDWESMDCDDTYDPYKLKSRISFMEEVDGLLHIRVNFADNCCADFTPGITFANNRLELVSATREDNEFCFCNCCFSLEYKIAGLSGKTFEVFFNGKKIEVSDEHYETQKVTYEMYRGEQINFTNKYGFKEGRWMAFHESGQVEYDGEFPNNVQYQDSEAIWYKRYNIDGELIYFDRKDSTQAWFEDREIRAEKYSYTKGDTSFKYIFRKFENRKLAEKSLVLSYPYTLRSELNPCFEEEGLRTETLYKETFYRDGQRENLLSNDTLYKWHENGNFREIVFPNGSKRFDEEGNLSSQVFRWKTKGPACQADLRHNLYVYYDSSNSIKKIDMTRDEALGEKTYKGQDYIWTWDENKKLTSIPEEWDEDFPWEKFELLVKQLEGHQLP